MTEKFAIEKIVTRYDKTDGHVYHDRKTCCESDSFSDLHRKFASCKKPRQQDASVEEYEFVSYRDGRKYFIDGSERAKMKLVFAEDRPMGVFLDNESGVKRLDKCMRECPKLFDYSETDSGETEQDSVYDYFESIFPLDYILRPVDRMTSDPFQ